MLLRYYFFFSIIININTEIIEDTNRDNPINQQENIIPKDPINQEENIIPKDNIPHQDIEKKEIHVVQNKTNTLKNKLLNNIYKFFYQYFNMENEFQLTYGDTINGTFNSDEKKKLTEDFDIYINEQIFSVKQLSFVILITTILLVLLHINSMEIKKRLKDLFIYIPLLLSSFIYSSEIINITFANKKRFIDKFNKNYTFVFKLSLMGILSTGTVMIYQNFNEIMEYNILESSFLNEIKKQSKKYEIASLIIIILTYFTHYVLAVEYSVKNLTHMKMYNSIYEDGTNILCTKSCDDVVILNLIEK